MLLEEFFHTFLMMLINNKNNNSDIGKHTQNINGHCTVYNCTLMYTSVVPKSRTRAFSRFKIDAFEISKFQIYRFFL